MGSSLTATNNEASAVISNGSEGTPGVGSLSLTTVSRSSTLQTGGPSSMDQQPVARRKRIKLDGAGKSGRLEGVTQSMVRRGRQIGFRRVASRREFGMASSHRRCGGERPRQAASVHLRSGIVRCGEVVVILTLTSPIVRLPTHRSSPATCIPGTVCESELMVAVRMSALIVGEYGRVTSVSWDLTWCHSNSLIDARRSSNRGTARCAPEVSTITVCPSIVPLIPMRDPFAENPPAQRSPSVSGS